MFPLRWVLAAGTAVVAGLHAADRRKNRREIAQFRQAIQNGLVRVFACGNSTPDPGVYQLALLGAAGNLAFHFASRVDWRGRRLCVLTWNATVMERSSNDGRSPPESLAAAFDALRRLPIRSGNGRR